MSDISAAIEAARTRIPELESPPKSDALGRAENLLLRAKTLAIAHDVHFVLPIISVLENGSIDLHWKDSFREVLVNIPVTGPLEYYGDDWDTLTVKGSFLEVHDKHVDFIIHLVGKFLYNAGGPGSW